jgi:tetratricopeptide (TPR) repeat protein
VFLKRVAFPKALAAVAAAAAIAIVLFVSRTRSPETSFLSGSGGGDWIVFPCAAEINPHPVADFEGVFRRSWVLDAEPREARLLVRAARLFELKINGHPVEKDAVGNWKEFTGADVLAHVRQGTNVIEVVVRNEEGPPALCLILKTDQATLRSDESWDASIGGSAVRRAMFASRARVPGRGNVVAGGERTFDALQSVWGQWLLFAVLAAALWRAGGVWLNSGPTPALGGPGVLSGRKAAGLLALLAGVWAVLFIHNAKLIPLDIGFDAKSHSDYIQYIQEHHRLPYANEGFEMYQPPLFYAVSALGLSCCGLTIADGDYFLRLLSMGVGIAHFTLVFLTLRLLLPGRTGAQLVGLLLAAFAPMQLYLSHYVTNETLAATLATGTIYLCVRLLKAKQVSTGLYVGLGVCMGAAILTKVTDILLIPFVVAVLLWKLARERPPIGIWLRTLLMLFVCLAVSYWYYILVWIRFGTPFVGNWDASLGFAWWQDHGYRTWADYTRFGRCLVSPLFSGFGGFADGVYSTFWGDALCGGTRRMIYRPPWNYSLMAAGYLLALAPTLMLACGALVAVWRFVRRPSSEQFLLLGFFSAVGFGLFWTSLTVASYAQAKAFYGSCALAVLCFFGAVGWEVLTRGRKRAQFALGTILLVCAMNSFASFWIRQNSQPARTFRGLWLASRGETNAALFELTAAVAADPASAQARRCLATTLDEFGRTSEAVPHATRAVELDPGNAANHWALGLTLARQGRVEPAISEERRAVEAGLECLSAYQFLADWCLQLGRNSEAADMARAGLAVSPYQAAFHHTLGLALVRTGDFSAGTNQLAYALRIQPRGVGVRLDLGHVLLSSGQGSNGVRQIEVALQLAPNSPGVLNELAWVLATNPDASLRDGQKAVQLAERACALTGGTDAQLLGSLAAAYGEAGRFHDAIGAVERAMSLMAPGPERDSNQALNREMLKCFRSQRPYRRNPSPL